MAQGINELRLIGYLGNKPEKSFTRDGKEVCTVSLATTKKWTNKEIGKSEEKTTWHRIKMFGKTAENANNILHKGDLAYFKAELTNEQWIDSETKIKKYATGIIANNFQSFAKKPDDTLDSK